MTITTTQFNLIDTMVKIYMENGDIELSINSDKSIFNQVVESFDIDLTNPNYVNSVELATWTLENVSKNIVEMYDMSVFSELSDYYTFDEALELIENESIIFHHGVYEMSELSENYVEEFGLPNNYQFYIDENALLRDLYMGGDIQEFYYQDQKEMALDEGKTEEEAREIASDYEPTQEDEQNYLEMILDCCSQDMEFVKRYFNYDLLARDMEIEGNYITCDNGIIEVL